jgi:hypothetical protein
MLNTVRLTNCLNGLFVDGADVNAGIGIGVSVSANKAYGILDSSFLGNTYIGAHSSANAFGSYKTDNANARNVFVGAYSEEGQPASSFVKPTLIIGGLHGAGITGSAQVIGANAQSGFVISTRNSSGRTIRASHSMKANVPVNLSVSGDHPAGWQFPMWNETQKVWDVRYARLNATSVMKLTTNLSAGTFFDEEGNSIPAGEMILPRGFWVPSPTVPGRYRKVMPKKGLYETD